MVAAVSPPTDSVPVLRRGRGRPAFLKLTEEKIIAAAQDVEKGLPYASALVRQGIPKASANAFLQNNPKVKLLFEAAETQFEKGRVDNLLSHESRDPKISQWLLERRLADKWVAVSRSEVSGANGGPIQHLTISRQLLGGITLKPDNELRNVTPKKAG